MKTTREARSEHTRVELEKAARSVFERHGYFGAKITDITREAGRAAGSFYNHFDSKEAVLLALARQIGDDADTIVAEQDVRAREKRTMRPHLEIFWQIFHRNRVVIDAMRDAALVHPEFAERIEGFTRVQFEPWVQRLRGFEEAGVVLPASAETTALLIGGTAEGFARNWTGDRAEGMETLIRFVDRSVFAEG
nr:TetR/AcrR family transcriptional regulator [Rhodococcus sp. (in: high G+C Gram-positive bacteria)]